MFEALTFAIVLSGKHNDNRSGRGVIALARIDPLLPRRRPRLPDLADSLRGLRIGVRSLCRSHPGYLAMAIFVLAVAVGVNLLVFTIVNALWIRPMPYPDPGQVATITNSAWTRLDGPRLQIWTAVPRARVAWATAAIP